MLNTRDVEGLSLPYNLKNDQQTIDPAAGAWHRVPGLQRPDVPPPHPRDSRSSADNRPF